MNRAAAIEQLKVTQETLAKLLALLESSGADKFVAHLYQARKQYRLVSERPNKGNKAIEREVIASLQIAQSLGFQGDFRQWEHLLRIHE
jgi:Holliday junction resolvase